MNKFIVPSLLSLAAVGQSVAAVLVEWNFTSNLTPTIVATSSVASAANATLSVGVSGGFQNNANATNVGPSTGNGTWSTSNSSVVAPYALGTADSVNSGSGFLNTSNYSTSPNATQYVGFQLTLNGTIDPSIAQLEGIKFNLSNAGTSGPRGVEVTCRIGTSGNFTSIGGTAVPTLAANHYGLFINRLIKEPTYAKMRSRLSGLENRIVSYQGLFAGTAGS